MITKEHLKVLEVNIMTIDPILSISNKKDSSLNNESVSFDIKNSFRNDDFNSINNQVKQNSKITKQQSITRKRTQSQRLADTTVLKCRTLQPFMTELEKVDKPSIDTVVEALAKFYVKNGLPNRQQDIFQGMYEMNINRLYK